MREQHSTERKRQNEVKREGRGRESKGKGSVYIVELTLSKRQLMEKCAPIRRNRSIKRLCGQFASTHFIYMF